MLFDPETLLEQSRQNPPSTVSRVSSYSRHVLIFVQGVQDVLDDHLKKNSKKDKGDAKKAQKKLVSSK